MFNATREGIRYHPCFLPRKAPHSRQRYSLYLAQTAAPPSSHSMFHVFDRGVGLADGEADAVAFSLITFLVPYPADRIAACQGVHPDKKIGVGLHEPVAHARHDSQVAELAVVLKDERIVLDR